MGEGASGPGIGAGLPVYAGTAEEMAAPPGIQPGTNITQAWSQGFVGNNGIGGNGSIFGATAYDAWYDSMIRLTDPMNGGTAITGWTPLRLNMNKLKRIRVTSYQSSNRTGMHGWYSPSKVNNFGFSFTMSPFRSHHSGVAHFLFADGSVHVIQENIDDKIYAGFSTMRGKEPLPNIEE